MTPSTTSSLVRALAHLGLVFYAWTARDGSLSFADPDRVPAAYKDTAVERTWVDLRAATDKQWTIDMSRSSD